MLAELKEALDQIEREGRAILLDNRYTSEQAGALVRSLITQLYSIEPVMATVKKEGSK